jgi:hypothetical protein
MFFICLLLQPVNRMLSHHLNGLPDGDSISYAMLNKIVPAFSILAAADHCRNQPVPKL